MIVEVYDDTKNHKLLIDFFHFFVVVIKRV